MRGRGRLFANHVLVALNECPEPPKFALRKIHATEVFQRIGANSPRLARPRRLGARHHAALAGEFGHSAVVLVGKTIRHGLAVVVQKPVGKLSAPDDPSVQNRQVGRGVVAAIFFEALYHVGGPVWVSRLEAVGGEAAERLSRVRTGLLHQLGADRIVNQVDSSAVEEVVFQSLKSRHWHRERGVCDAVSRANHSPIALGHIPLERAVRFQFRGQIYHIARLHRSIVRQRNPRHERRLVHAVGGHVAIPAHAVRLDAEVLARSGFAAFGRAKSDHDRIAVIHFFRRNLEAFTPAVAGRDIRVAVIRLRNVELAGKFLRSLDCGLGLQIPARGFLRRDPFAAHVPAGRHVHIHRNPESCGFLQSVTVEFTPFGGQKRRAVLAECIRVLTAIDEQHGTHALGFELLEVIRDARLVHKGVHPPPIDPGARLDWRVLELLREVFSSV